MAPAWLDIEGFEQLPPHLILSTINGADVIPWPSSIAGRLDQLIEAVRSLRQELREPVPAVAEWPKTVAQYAAFIGKSVWTVHKRIRLKLLDCEQRDGQGTFITQAQHERFANGQSGLLRERNRR